MRHIALVHRTGTEHFTITDAHPYHKPVGRIDPKGAGNYTIGYDPHCPLCRQEHEEQENADGDHPAYRTCHASGYCTPICSTCAQ